MLDKYFIQIDRNLLLRFVEAVERIAPPPSESKELPAPEPTGEEDVISMTDEEFNRKDLQWQLDDLVEALSEKGYGEANKDEIAQLTDLKRRIEEADLGDTDDDTAD